MGLEAQVMSTGSNGPRPYLRLSSEKGEWCFSNRLVHQLGITKGNINNTAVYVKFKVSRVTSYAGRAVNMDAVTL